MSSSITTSKTNNSSIEVPETDAATPEGVDAEESSSGMIDIGKDEEGLREAMREMMEEVREQEHCDGGETSSSGRKTRRSLSPGYYLMLCRVANEVDAQLRAGVRFSDVRIDPDDELARSIVAEKCAEFVQKFPACSVCGTPIDDWREGTCAACGDALANSKGRVN